MALRFRIFFKVMVLNQRIIWQRDDLARGRTFVEKIQCPNPLTTSEKSHICKLICHLRRASCVGAQTWLLVSTASNSAKPDLNKAGKTPTKDLIKEMSRPKF
jgi:hypothetical protein